MQKNHLVITALILSAALIVARASAKGGSSSGAGKSEGATTATIGASAPGFALEASDGKTYRLDDVKDKIVVLEWFNRECPVTRAYHDKMKAACERYSKKGVVWLAIDSTNYHTTRENSDYAKTAKIPYPILSDFDGKVGRAYGARTTPHIFIVNKGTLAYMGSLDERNGSRQYAAEALDALLAGKDVPVSKTESFGCSVKYKR